MLSELSTRISPGMLQNLLVYNADLNSLVMARIPGKTLNDFHLEYAMTMNFEDFSFKSSRDAFGWFVNIEIRRAYECGLLYSVGKDLADAPEGLDSPIHKFYYNRLHNDVKFTKHYYPTTPGFSGDNAVQFDDFIALPWKSMARSIPHFRSPSGRQNGFSILMVTFYQKCGSVWD